MAQQLPYGSENRRFKRWDTFEYAMITNEDNGDVEPGIIVDLSLGGLQCRARKQYEAGSTCKLSIVDARDRTIETLAEVRYSNPIPDSDLFSTGFRFMPTSVEQRVDLVNYIHERFQSEVNSED